MLIFGDEGNSASDSVVIKTSTGVTINLFGDQEQLFDASTIETAEAMDGAVAVENIEKAVELSTIVDDVNEVIDEEKESEEEDESKSEDDGEVVIAARTGDVVDVESQTRDSDFPDEETAAGEDESQKKYGSTEYAS